MIATGATAAPDVINPGTQAWVQAAQTGRADMLILGDSVVWHNGDGWDAGMIAAANNTLGLAGTGLIPNSDVTGEGEGYGVYGEYNGAWNTSPSAVYGGRTGYVFHGVAVTAPSTPVSMFGYGVDGTTLPANAAYDWDVYTSSADGGGSMGAYRRTTVGGFNTLQTIAPVSTSTPATGLQQTVFHFDANNLPANQPQEMFLQNVTNTSILYSRLIRPGATGVTVSSWGYGGHDAGQFLQDQYLGTMSQPGREQLLSAMTDGGSGKLNVMITEGFNDRNRQTPSVNGVTPGNSAAAFADDIETLVGQVRADWVAAGKSPSDLSFTLVGMYQDAYYGQTMIDYENAEAAIAAADPQISFVDLADKGLDYQTELADGYFYLDPTTGTYDPTHPSREGAMVYSQMIMNALVPEPTMLGAAAGVGLTLLMRRERRRRR